MKKKQLLNLQNSSFFVLVNKPVGVSSFGFINKFKKIFGTKKIGHTGTLDPAASGLLILAVNQATKLINYLKSESKEYEFKILFGKQTDSFDLDGNVIEENEKMPSLEEIKEVIKQFLGKMKQIPNKFSAIKINGKRAYVLARANVEFEMKERDVFIYNLEFLSFENNEVNLKVKCSPGFYVRSLACDICEKLNVLGVVSRIHRINDGVFSLNQVEDEYQVIDLNFFKNIYKSLELSDEEIEKLNNGAQLKYYYADDIYVCINKAHAFQGVIKVERGVIFPLRMIKNIYEIC